MPLQVLPLQVSDLNTLISHASLHQPGDDLVAPPNPVAWPVTTRSEAQMRARHCFALQHRRLIRDPTTKFVKVVDEDNLDDIVAVARWHYYPHGYDYATEGHWEMAPTAPLTDYLPPRGTGDMERDLGDDAYPPPNFNLALHNHILSARDSFRPSWIPAHKPCWILMHLVTRPSHRGRGAAGMLIRWGMECAQETGADGFLEAGVQGRPVYLRYGFKQVGEDRRVNLREYVGAEGAPTEFVLANMQWSPESREKGPNESVS